MDADLCDIPTEDIDALSTLLSKGLDFLMAYNTLIAAFGYSPNKSHEDIKDWIVSNEPEYKRFYDEVYGQPQKRSNTNPPESSAGN